MRFQSAGLQPPLPGLSLAVRGGRITATNRSPRTVTVLDEHDRPWFRLHPGGRTEQRTAIGWLAQSTTGSVTWHDHRTGRPGRARILVLDERGGRFVLAGTVVAVAAPERAPLWPVLLLVAAAGAAALLVRRVL